MVLDLITVPYAIEGVQLLSGTVAMGFTGIASSYEERKNAIFVSPYPVR